MGQEYVPVSILDGDRKISLMALKDTGNTLRDPITGEQVMVIGADKAEELTGLPAIAFSTPAETAVKHPGYRLIPYHAVGQPTGLLLSKRYPEVMLGKRRSSALIAFAPEIMDSGGMYQGLTGGTV
jgi:stage II sporulation protein GA (sporulation sigma-E factor processing peptidase)